MPLRRDGGPLPAVRAVFVALGVCLRDGHLRIILHAGAVVDGMDRMGPGADINDGIRRNAMDLLRGSWRGLRRDSLGISIDNS